MKDFPEIDYVCPNVRLLMIKINDTDWWTDDADRTHVLMQYVDKILNTKNVELESKRAFLCADYAVRVFAAKALEAAGRQEDAAKLRACDPIIDCKTALAGRAVALSAARAAATARADVDDATLAAARACTHVDAIDAARAARAHSVAARAAATRAAVHADAALSAARAAAAARVAAAAAAAVDARDDDVITHTLAAATTATTRVKNRALALELLTKLCEITK